VRRVDIVELDAGVVRLARHDPALSGLNGHVYDDPRVHVTTGDAFDLLRGVRPGSYDVVIADLPDPGITASTKLYSEEFYGLARRALADRGRLVVHAGPVASRRHVFWTVVATIRAAGLHPVPYRVGGRASGFAAGPDRTTGTSRAPRDWGFVLATRGVAPAEPGLESEERAAERTLVPGLVASTLVHPRY
jgi:spermidine synthase